MGGVQAAIPLPYPYLMVNEITVRGAFMYPRHVPGDIARMIKAGLIDLDALTPHVFSLSDIHEAIAQAGKFKGLDYCVVMP